MQNRVSMTDAESGYVNLLQNVLTHGKTKALYNSDRTITSLIGQSIHHDFRMAGFPIYKGKFVYWKGAIAEMLWFLSGHSDIKAIRDMKCHVWDDWAWKHWQDVQSVPDHMWRYNSLSREEYFEHIDSGELITDIPLHYTNATNWHSTGLNQTKWVLEQLPQKPYRKSYLVDSWDASTVYHMADESNKQSVCLPACHFAHQLLCQEPNKLSMVVYIRSNDLFLGNPFNVVQYGTLLQMYCHCLSNRTGVMYKPDELSIMIGDAHVYSNHETQCLNHINRCESSYALLKEYDATVPKGFSWSRKANLVIKQRGQKSLTDFQLDDFSLEGYMHLGKLRGEIYVAGGYENV